MEPETLPRVLILDLDAKTGLAEAVEQHLSRFCTVVREVDFSALPAPPIAKGSIETSGIGEFVAVVICSGDIDLARERKIALALSGWTEVPVLLVTQTGDPVAVSRLRSDLGCEFAAVIVRSSHILRRMLRAWTGSRPESDSRDADVDRDLVLERLVGESKAFTEMIRMLRKAADSDCVVLIQGETGTGKEMCARAIHELSRRSRHSFVAINCGAIPEELMESVLVGHERGAFTGATEARNGLIQKAEGGTLFLDEISCLPVSAQVKLLRVLQERECRRLGSTQTIHTNVRVIAATNTDLLEAVHSGRFRDDLYYRLHVVLLTVPPLRDRGEDVILLAEHFLRNATADSENPAPSLPAGAKAKLRAHDWPGNVRELEHAITRAVVFAEDPRLLSGRDITLRARKPRLLVGSFAEAKARFETDYVEKLVVAHDGSVKRSASSAGMHEETLRRMIRRLGIDLKKLRARL